MAVEILMPALSPTMETGKLAKWLVKEGDSVKPGDVIAEIETDKATMEVEAVDEGTVGRLLIAAGTEDVAVNTPIAVLVGDGESPPEPAAKAAPAPQPAPAAPETKPAVAEAKPAAPEAKPAAAQPPAEGGARVFASPLARRVAAEAGLDLARLKGSGPGGRIVLADVEAARRDGVPAAAPAAPTQPPAAAAQPPVAGMADDIVRRLFEPGSFEEKPHDSMRRTIAARLTESHQSIPSYLITVECDIGTLSKLRLDLNAAAPKGEGDAPAYKLSINDLVVKAMALALRDVPMANASWTSTARLLHRHADVGVAVAIPDGLITPIVRRAETKSLSAISNEIKDMARRARDRKLKPEEYQGGSTAVSNLGMFGVQAFTSIINPPHASIVSIGAGERRAVVRGDAIAVAEMMTATFAFDHRVIDGALGAELAARFRHYAEHPLAMLV